MTSEARVSVSRTATSTDAVMMTIAEKDAESDSFAVREARTRASTTVVRLASVTLPSDANEIVVKISAENPRGGCGGGGCGGGFGGGGGGSGGDGGGGDGGGAHWTLTPPPLPPQGFHGWFV